MNNAPSLPAPSLYSQAGNNLREPTGSAAFITRANRWRPKGAYKEVIAATASRVALMLVDRLTGVAYSANQCRPIPGTPVNGVKATGTLTGTTIAEDDTVTIGSITYTFVDELSDPDVANEVLVGASDSDSLDNLIAAINGDTGEGTLYSTGTQHVESAVAAAGDDDTMTLTALAAGTSGNSIATTASLTSGDWEDATLTDGVNATTAVAGQVLYDSDAIYIALADVSVTSTTGWKKVELSTL